MEWVEGTRFGWFLGGIIVVGFIAVAWWMYNKVKARREKETGRL